MLDDGKMRILRGDTGGQKKRPSTRTAKVKASLWRAYQRSVPVVAKKSPGRAGAGIIEARYLQGVEWSAVFTTFRNRLFEWPVSSNITFVTGA
jgi:hypothetical protein